VSSFFSIIVYTHDWVADIKSTFKPLNVNSLGKAHFHLYMNLLKIEHFQFYQDDAILDGKKDHVFGRNRYSLVCG